MKEAVIRKKALEELHSDGWITWYPYKMRYKKEQDIFGVFDIIAIHPDGIILLLQITSYSNVSARKKKIQNFLDENQLDLAKFHPRYSEGEIYVEVWGWNTKKKAFRKDILH